MSFGLNSDYWILFELCDSVGVQYALNIKIIITSDAIYLGFFFISETSYVEQAPHNVSIAESST